MSAEIAELVAGCDDRSETKRDMPAETRAELVRPPPVGQPAFDGPGVIVPLYPGVYSAIGLLMSELAASLAGRPTTVEPNNSRRPVSSSSLV